MFRHILFSCLFLTAACGPQRYWQPVEGLGHPPGIDYQAQTCEQRLAQRMRIYADAGQDGNCRIQDRTSQMGFNTWVQVRACDVTCNPRPLPSSIQPRTSYSRQAGPSDAEVRERQAERRLSPEELRNIWSLMEESRKSAEKPDEETVEESADLSKRRVEQVVSRPTATRTENQPQPEASPKQPETPFMDRVQTKAKTAGERASEAAASGWSAVSGAAKRMLTVDCNEYRREWAKIVKKYNCGQSDEFTVSCDLERIAWSTEIRECK